MAPNKHIRSTEQDVEDYYFFFNSFSQWLLCALHSWQFFFVLSNMASTPTLRHLRINRLQLGVTEHEFVLISICSVRIKEFMVGINRPPDSLSNLQGSSS